MTPSQNNEIRDLQPVVRRIALRAGTFVASLMCGAAALSLFCAARVALMDEQVWAVTASGRPFQLTPVPREQAKRFLALPGAAAAVAEARR